MEFINIIMEEAYLVIMVESKTGKCVGKHIAMRGWVLERERYIW